MTPSLPRVALVSDYSLATLGGAENAYHDQARALATHTEVLAVGPPSDRLTKLGVRTLPIRALATVDSLGFPVIVNTPRLRARLVAAFRDHGTEVVHLHSEFGLAAAAIAAARTLGLPVIQTVHTFFWAAGPTMQRPAQLLGPVLHRGVTGIAHRGVRLAERPGDSALRNMTLAVARRVDQVVSPSAHQAERLRDAGLARVSALPNTVADNPDAAPVTAIDGPLRVLWIGRFAAEKRVLPFVRAARAAVDAAGPDRLRVDLIGSGPEFAEAGRLAAGPGITLHGRQPHADVPLWLARSHVTALSSVGWDNQPMTVAESIMAGRGGVYCDPVLTEGLDRAGIPAFGPDSVLRDRLVALAGDPAPVLAASAAAMDVRPMFGVDAFVAGISEVYARAARTQTHLTTPRTATERTP
ncbi:glycosyltransferase [Mariniluteicoccus flavus]